MWGQSDLSAHGLVGGGRIQTTEALRGAEQQKAKFRLLTRELAGRGAGCG